MSNKVCFQIKPNYYFISKYNLFARTKIYNTSTTKEEIILKNSNTLKISDVSVKFLHSTISDFNLVALVSKHIRSMYFFIEETCHTCT